MQSLRKDSRSQSLQFTCNYEPTAFRSSLLVGINSKYIIVNLTVIDTLLYFFKIFSLGCQTSL